MFFFNIFLFVCKTSGSGFHKVVDSLDPNEEYHYRLCVIDSHNKHSEFSEKLTVKTPKEPITCESLHRAIVLYNMQ